MLSSFPAHDAEQSGPYRRDSSEDAGRAGQLRKRIFTRVRIIDQGDLDKDHPTFSGCFIFTSKTKPQPKKEPDTSKQPGKEEDWPCA